MLVPQAVFGALGVNGLSAGLSLSSLAEYLGSNRLLLVLDNCEHPGVLSRGLGRSAHQTPGDTPTQHQRWHRDGPAGGYGGGMTAQPASRAPAALLEAAEVEATLAAHREWVAAGRPGAVSHDEAMAELLSGQ